MTTHDKLIANANKARHIRYAERELSLAPRPDMPLVEALKEDKVHLGNALDAAEMEIAALRAALQNANLAWW